ncbi:MAG: leucine-rich repeat domain-containing protein [Aureispira sp.]
MYFNTALSRKKSSVQEISIYGTRDGGIDNYHLSEELYTFTALENLYISEDFLALSPKIAALQHLKSLYINSRMIKELPEEIGQLQQLRSLTVSGEIFERFPDSIAQLKNLETLSINGCPKLTSIPYCLRRLPKLNSISLHRGHWNNVTAFEEGFAPLRELRIVSSKLTNALVLPIFKLTQLTHLNLSQSHLKTIPKELLALKELVHLSLSENEIKQLPTFLTQLSNLKSFSFKSNQVQDFPVFLNQLPQLISLTWQFNAFGKYDKGLLAFPISITNPYYKVGASSKYRNFLEAVQVCEFSPKALILFFDIQNGHPLNKVDFERTHFLELLSFKDKSFKSIVIDHLLEYEKARFEAHPLSPTSGLMVLGKSTIPKSQIRSLLKEKGIPYQTKITPQTSHLLVGNTGIKDYSILKDTSYILLSQQALQEYVNEATKPYLLDEESQDNLEHIAALLSSTSTENQQLGVELLKGGGTPKELLTELFIVYKFSADKKLATKAKKLLSTNASTALLEKLKLRINLRAVKEAYHTGTKIEELTEGTELEAWKIAQYACFLNPSVWGNKTFLGVKDAPEAIAKAFLPKIVQLQMRDKHYTVEPSLLPYIQLLYQTCDFLDALRFKDVARNLEGISAMKQLKNVSFYFTKDTVLPHDLHLIPQLEGIDFTSTTLADWGAALEQLSQSKSLKRLSFWSSMRTGLPPNFLQLQQLEQLSLTRALLEKKDIALLAQLPNLKQVSFDSTSAHLEDMYLQLQQVEEFYFRQEEVYQITARLSEMTALKKLTLTGPFSFTGVLQLPHLEQLRLETNYRKKEPILPQHICQLTSLKYLEIRGEVLDVTSILPHFKHLEELTLMHNKAAINDLIPALQQLPHLKKLKRYFSVADLAAVQRALPNLIIST